MKRLALIVMIAVAAYVVPLSGLAASMDDAAASRLEHVGWVALLAITSTAAVLAYARLWRMAIRR